MCEKCEEIVHLPCTTCGLPSDGALQHDDGTLVPYCITHAPCQRKGCGKPRDMVLPDIDGEPMMLCEEHAPLFIRAQLATLIGVFDDLAQEAEAAQERKDIASQN